MKKLNFAINCLIAIALAWFTGCTKNVVADFDCPEFVYADRYFEVTNYSINAYDYIWEYGNNLHISASESFDEALATATAYGFDNFLGSTGEEYGYYIGYTPCDITFKYSGSKKVALHAYSKNGRRSDHKVKYVTVYEDPDASGNGSNSGNTNTPDNPVVQPSASFTISSNNGTYAPATIQCNNTSTNATSYQWTLTKPDYSTSTSTATNPSFTCSQAGTYTMKLIASNSSGYTSTATKTFTLTSLSSFTITNLRLQQIPMLASDNSSWDTGLLSGADPDIYFKIIDSNNTVIYTSAIKSNVSEPSLPVTWQDVNVTLDYGSTYYVRFYDSDDIDSDDMMSGCIFDSTHITPGNSSFTWTATSGTTKFTVGLRW